VDFPEPLSPTIKTNSPSAISRFTLFSAGTPAEYDLLTFSNLIFSYSFFDTLYHLNILWEKMEGVVG
jgi:hypothetical protein